MKILWVSDSPTAPSGFGNVTRAVCAGLATRGHAVHVIGWQHHGDAIAWEGCMLHPVARNGLGADVLPGYLRRLRPDVLVTLADVWWLTWIADPVNRDFLRTAGIPWVLYYPIDADCGQQRLPPSWVQVLQTVHLPVAMSRYGQDVSRANGVQAAYVPHGVDADTFRPPDDKETAKRLLGYGGRFVILSDARNWLLIVGTPPPGAGIARRPRALQRASAASGAGSDRRIHPPARTLSMRLAKAGYTDTICPEVFCTSTGELHE